MDLNQTRTFLLDGDGVLWHGDRPARGLVRFFGLLAERGIRWGLLTNNATRSPEYLVEKFRGFGVTVETSSIFTSADATVRYLQTHATTGARVYVVGEVGLIETLERGGFAVDTALDEGVDVIAVVVGLDRDFTYQKLKKAMRLINRGATFIATNPDNSFPGPHGLSPGAGSMVAAVATACGVEPMFMGKPAAPLFEVAMTALGAAPETTVMVGDRLDTDISGAKNLGMRSLLVLSGVSRRDDIERLGIRPDEVFDDIAAVAVALERQVV